MKASRLAALVGAGVAIGLYLHNAARLFGQFNDDAWITYRYSHFLAAGRGPYFNLGDHVEGYTNFLLMLVLAAVDGVFGPHAVPDASKAIGIAGGSLAVLAASALLASWLTETRSLQPWSAALGTGAGLLVAANTAFAMNSTTGLETALFAGLLALGLLLVERGRTAGRWRGAGVPLALACLTRPEGALIFGATIAGRLVAGDWRTSEARRRLLADTALVAVVVASHFAFRFWAYDGELLPNTYYAKAGGAFGSPSQYLVDFARAHLTLLLTPFVLAPLLSRTPALRAATLPAFSVLCAAVFAVFFTGTDWMPGYRLLCPYLPAWAALAGLGIALACDRLGRGAPALAGLALAGSAAGAAFWQAPTFDAFLDHVATRRLSCRRGNEALAAWVAARARPDDTIVLMDIGLIGVRLMDLNVVDISGLTDRHIAKLPGGFLAKSADPAYVLSRRPEFVVLTFAVPPGEPERATAWTAMERALLDDPLFRRDYVRPRAAAPGASELERFTSMVGATQVFDATALSYRYYFAAFTRSDPAPRE